METAPAHSTQHARHIPRLLHAATVLIYLGMVLLHEGVVHPVSQRRVCAALVDYHLGMLDMVLLEVVISQGLALGQW